LSVYIEFADGNAVGILLPTLPLNACDFAGFAITNGAKTGQLRSVLRPTSGRRVYLNTRGVGYRCGLEFLCVPQENQSRQSAEFAFDKSLATLLTSL
jgi:hypothetical protein